jgi:outer membrane protein OmpA-like peptidoglycan-associated protein
MRPLPILSAVLLATATPVLAQVTVDLHALQALPERPTTSAPARPPRPAVRNGPTVVTRVAPITPPAEATASAAPTAGAAPAGASQAGNSGTGTGSGTGAAGATASAGKPGAPASVPAQQPTMPQSAPVTAAINPIAPPQPAAGSPPPPPPPVSDKALTTAAPTAAGLRLIFAPEQSDLSPESVTSIKQLAAAAPTGDETTFSVQAYAPGTANDPSTARRVSLSRAMAVRSALVIDGVPSARIFVRALGEQYGNGPADRVDITVSAPASSASAK